MEGSLRLELSYHSLTGYCVTATLTTHIGALGENRTHRTTLLRRIRLPVASQGHMVEFKVTLSAHGFLTTKTSFALKRRWFRMSESNCYSYAQGMCVNHYTTFEIYYWFSIIYYIINSIKSQVLVGQRGADPPSSCSSNTRSDRLSYWPILTMRAELFTLAAP